MEDAKDKLIMDSKLDTEELSHLQILNGEITITIVVKLIKEFAEFVDKQDNKKIIKNAVIIKIAKVNIVMEI